MPAERVLPATCLQRRQVLAALGNRRVPNLVFAWRLRAPLQPSAVVAALELLVSRHEALRTALRKNGRELEQYIEHAVTLPLELLRTPNRRTFRTMLRRHLNEQFAVGIAPLALVTLVRIASADHLLVWTMHHAVCDGWSIDVLLRDFEFAYTAAVDNRRPEWPALPVQLGDYAAWERSHVDTRADAYWRDHAPASVPRLALRARSVQPASAEHIEAVQALKPISPAVTQTLNAACQDAGATLSMALIAAFAALLGPYSSNGSLAIGATQANRDRHELRHVVGCCIDFIPLHLHVGGSVTYLEAVAQVQDQLRLGRAHRLPICRIAEGTWPWSPTWFDVLVNFTRAATPARSQEPLVGHAFGPAPRGYTARYNWSGWRAFGPMLHLDEHGALSGSLLYNHRLVSAGFARQLADRFDQLVRAAAARPDRAVRWLMSSSARQLGAAAGPVGKR